MRRTATKSSTAHAGHSQLIQNKTFSTFSSAVCPSTILELGSTAAEDLLEVFVRRHETASTLITTNRPTQDWGIFLGDVPAATAILDRFLAHATIVQVTGKSYRLRQRASTTGD